MKTGPLTLCLLIAACGPGGRTGDDTVGGGGSVDAAAPHVPPAGQHLLMLDFRSGWWAGSAGDFHKNVLEPLRSLASDITIEFHHFTVGSDVKCVYPAGGSPACGNASMSSTPTPDEVVARFDLQRWDDYTQVWILSGSEKDMSDITVSGDLFAQFASQAGNSCIPVFIGAGDGFIDHGNAMAQALGIGPILSTAFAQPGFFFGGLSITVDSEMMAGTQLDADPLFNGVQMIADGVANGLQHTHGDSLVANPMVEVIAHDSAGNPAIGVGSLALPNGQSRPFVIDAGMQRYYAVHAQPDTLTLLENIEKKLATVGCRAIIE